MGRGVQAHGGASGPGNDWGVRRQWGNMVPSILRASGHSVVQSSGTCCLSSCTSEGRLWDTS